MLQSRSIVLSTIDDAGQSMIGNINKRDRRKQKKKLSSFLVFFFFSSSAACNRDTVLESCSRFVGIRSVRLLYTPILHLGQQDVSSVVDESTLKRTRFTHVIQRHSVVFFFCSLRSRPSLGCMMCAHRNSLRCLFVLRFGEQEMTRGVTNAAHYSEIASQRVPTQFPDFRSRPVASFRLH